MLEENNNVMTGVEIPSVIFGTSSLGNLYKDTGIENKKEIIRECILNTSGKAVFDTAGKYGAGLAMETLGYCLEALNIDPDQVIICNKLGWFQTELLTEQPTFEPGVWVNLKNDAVQKISYEGILACFEQGNQLLGKYHAQMVSVHDPDEYLLAAEDPAEREKRYNDILDAYKALLELKDQGKVKSVGIGSKDWKVIQRICSDVKLDWVMIANCLTVHDHPQNLIDFIGELHNKGILVINSAVFNGGFLIGSDHYNYKKVNKNSTWGSNLYIWRYRFYAICKKFNIDPAQACFDFGFNIPGVAAVALNTTRPEKVKTNINMVNQSVPHKFWEAMYDAKLIHLPISF
ncbi:aldo/keto reductase [Pedobacter sp. PWIIR3]